MLYYDAAGITLILTLHGCDIDHVEQSPMCSNRLQCLERLFIDSCVSCTSPPQCLPLTKNDVKLHNGKVVVELLLEKPFHFYIRQGIKNKLNYCKTA